MKTILLTLLVFSVVLSDDYSVDNYIRINDTVKFATLEYKPHITCEQRNYDWAFNDLVYRGPSLSISETYNDTTYTVENNGNEYLIIRKYQVVDTVKVKVTK